MTRNAIPPEVAERLGPCYVYLLVDPRSDEPFYVGQGTGQRVMQHGRRADLRGVGGLTQARITSIRRAGKEPRIDIVRHGLSKREALRVETALIDTLAPLVDLTNSVKGHDAQRTTLDELITVYGSEPLTATDPPVLLIRLRPGWIEKSEALERGHRRLGTGWYAGIDAQTLFDATRGWWKISPRQIERRNIEHAVCVVRGVTRALYRIDDWIGPRGDGRHAFTGRIVTRGSVWNAYVGSFGKRVPFTEHSQNPTLYWPRNQTDPGH